MQITLRRLGPIEVLRLGRKIVRDFHRYELAGYHYAERSIFAGRSMALEIAAAGRPCGYLVHELPDPDGLLRVAYLATGCGATALVRRCSGSSVRTTPTPPSTLKWRTLPPPEAGPRPS